MPITTNQQCAGCTETTFVLRFSVDAQGDFLLWAHRALEIDDRTAATGAGPLSLSRARAKVKLWVRVSGTRPVQPRRPLARSGVTMSDGPRTASDEAASGSCRESLELWRNTLENGIRLLFLDGYGAGVTGHLSAKIPKLFQ